MNSTSINKATHVKVVSSSSNETLKVIPSTLLNYCNDYDTFLKILSISLRLHPDDPHYIVKKVTHKGIELSSDIMKQFIENNVLNVNNDKKINIIVEVENDDSNNNKNNKRNPSPMRYKSPVVSRNSSPVPNRQRISSSPSRDQITPKRGGPQSSPMRRPLIAPSTPKVVKSIQKSINDRPISNDNDDEFASFSKGHYKDGRPSIGTMQQQWEFMRDQFVSGNNDELDWQMIKNKKKKGQYLYCKNKYDQSEEDYFKSLAHIELYESKSLLLVGPNAVLSQSISLIASEHETFKIYGSSDEAEKNVKAAQINLSKCLDNESKLLDVFDEETVKLLRLIADVDTAKRAASLAAGFKSTHMDSLVQQLTGELSKARKLEQVSINLMEKWSNRQKNTADIFDSLRDEEDEWKKKEEDKNIEALKKMRTIIPLQVESMTISDIGKCFKESGGLVTMELASELKVNRLLHWIVMHPDDIKSANFLVGAAKQYFENLESLDIVELRALLLCLPDKFDNDQNGKKQEWRQRFFERVKLLSSQENGEEVKGTFDVTTGQRRMVKLPELNNDQRRRSVYYYRRYSVCQQQLQKYDDKENLLIKKESVLKKATQEVVDSKTEYDIILAEMRNPALKSKYDYSTVKEQAKKIWMDAEANRKNLSFEVTRLRTAISNNPVTKEQFLAIMDDVEKYFSERGLDWKSVDASSSSSTSSILIDGPFDPTPVLVKTFRETAKCVSVEQEALMRKQELSALPTSAASLSESSSSSLSPLPDKPTNSLIKQMQASIIESSSSSAAESSSVTPKKVSVNSDMLTVLNKMFSPVPAASTYSLTPKRIPVVRNDDDKENANNSVNNEIKETQTQSKLLKKMLVNSNDVSSPMPASNNKIGFLDAIKKRKIVE